MKTGLLLIDIQNDYFPGGKLELVGIERASQNAQRLLASFRERRRPTFHIQHIETESNAPFFVTGTPGVEIHASVKPMENELVIQKHFPNSFRQTVLLDELRTAGIEQVVICGAMSHMCVDATTRAAADYGFDCIVVHDACATRNLDFGRQTIAADEVQGSFMAALGSAYANVISTSEALSMK